MILKYHDWLEYSVTGDATYCLCYLFQDESILQGGCETFPSIRSRVDTKKIDMHIGKSNNA